MRKNPGGLPRSKWANPQPPVEAYFCRVLDHELNPVLGWPGHEGLETAKGFFAFLQRVVTPGESGDDGAVRVRKRPFPSRP